MAPVICLSVAEAPSLMTLVYRQIERAGWMSADAGEFH
jgi:hypothetical protein